MNYYIEKHDMEIILDALSLLHLEMIEARENPTDKPYTAEDVDGLFQSLDNSGNYALEEAKLHVSDVKLFTILSVPHINQIYTFFSGKIVNDDFGPTPESSEVKLFKVDEIPWEELAFPTVIKTLKIYLEHGDEKVFNEVLEYKR